MTEDELCDAMQALDLSPSDIARLTGVEARTVLRWMGLDTSYPKAPPEYVETIIGLLRQLAKHKRRAA